MEWNEAVQDGILPDIAPDIKAKIQGGAGYDSLTEAERNDVGLKAFNEARLLHAKLKSEGKSNSFYRTVAKHYSPNPAGTRAPVFGLAQGNSISSDTDYKEIKENRMKRYGF